MQYYGIVDSAGNEVVKYIYDPWGKILSTSGSLASTLGTIQPFRYRGYVYDEETGLYYLRSRYYHPFWGRFVNSDDLAYLGQQNNLMGYNQFIYCSNNYVKKIDTEGTVEQDCYDEDGVPGSLNDISGGSVGGSSRLSSITQGLTIKRVGAKSPRHHTPDQQALNELVKPFSKTGLSLDNAQTLVNWGLEVGYFNSRIDYGHSYHSGTMGKIVHCHIGPYNHIPIIPIMYID